ncbi:MAG: hypothetical protein K0Q59_3281 [Paenibacillus sp.]|nr:hypothetical protein [Paenibacillus sp.]
MSMPTGVMMIIERLTDLPKITLPQGYRIDSLKPGQEADWEAIIEESFQKPYVFATSMASEKPYAPERVFFVLHEERPVATATAWHLDKYGEETGILHMVGALSGHSGKALGRQVSIAAIERMRDEGRKQVMLNTSVERLPAIKTYLNIGFQPKMVDETHMERWKYVAETLKDERLKRYLGM